MNKNNRNKKNQEKPLVLCAVNEVGNYLCVGVPTPSESLRK